MKSLEELLEQSRAIGHLGPGPVEDHLRNAEGFLAAIDPARDSRILDLGSGGGLPGLVIAATFSEIQVTLLDARERRCDFLEWAAQAGELTNVTVICGRSETLARRPDLEFQFDVVTARSFGPPSATAENACRFLREDGRVLVSEPPEARPWDAEALVALGLEPTTLIRYEVTGIQTLLRVGSPDVRYPRAVGVPTKRPLF